MQTKCPKLFIYGKKLAASPIAITIGFDGVRVKELPDMAELPGHWPKMVAQTIQRR